MRTSVTISSSASAFVKKSTMNSVIGIVRSPLRPARDDVGTGREQHRVPVALGIAVRDRPAQRAAVAHERIGDPRRRRRDRAEGEVGAHDVGVADQRADAQVTVVALERVEPGDPVDVDELRG